MFLNQPSRKNVCPELVDGVSLIDINANGSDGASFNKVTVTYLIALAERHLQVNSMGAISILSSRKPTETPTDELRIPTSGNDGKYDYNPHQSLSPLHIYNKCMKRDKPYW